MLRIVKHDFFFDFLSAAKKTQFLSGILILVSIGLVVGVGPKYGIDFKGGTDIILTFSGGVTSDEVRDAAADAGFPDANVQTFGTDKTQFLVQTSAVSVVDQPTIDNVVKAVEGIGDIERTVWNADQPDRMDVVYKVPNISADKVVAAAAGIVGKVEIEEIGTEGQPSHFVLRFEDLQNRILEGFSKALGDRFDPATGIERLETVGPRVGRQLRDSGVLSLLVALLLILIYIAFRFDVRYAPGAVLALAHDVTIAIGFFTLIGMEVNLPIVAALLTIIGYSLNDTIVVFDRIRENLISTGENDVPGVVNQSISETLSRTIITSLTTMLAVAAIAYFGSGLIEDFAVALMVGIVVGTYSSVFVASPVTVFMDSYFKTRKLSAAKSST